MLLRYREGVAVSYYVHEMGKQSYNKENENKKVSEDCYNGFTKEWVRWTPA